MRGDLTAGSRLLCILRTVTCFRLFSAQSDITQSSYSGASTVKSVECPVQLIPTFAFSHTAPLGDVLISSGLQCMCSRDLSFSQNEWKCNFFGKIIDNVIVRY